MFLLHHLNKYLTLTFCSFIKSLKIKLKWVCETTGRNTYARVPSRKSSTPPDWDFQTPSPPTFQTLEQKIRHRKCYAFNLPQINNDNMVIWTLFQNSKMTKHLSDDRPPAYDSQIFFPPEIKHHKKDQNASSVSVIYFKTASLLFIGSAFMLWFSIYTAWQLFYVTNMAMVKNYCYKFITNTSRIIIKNPWCKYIANNSEVLVKKIYEST